ncbi:peptide ABC transporter substrate-binding protein [Hypericibacter adhaerens]|jgi:peptide/nickel transport system substrate-binding protein|uniref:Peptide ABC transporter substrate-binding protein n=1 Tax=Hypericibacter adhaerens TaxID=2602016 RepID=A0A5J6N0P5_9PROT|nr:ABC transporter substrate-binding protein [Hypericibacter adhaerens]QEX22663.1 peptide ABC transporter substrate-binding protein [Hypericibacter adhaerens]
MSEIAYLQRQIMRGRLSRRAFLGRATALGLSAASASLLFAQAARAATPQKGGHLVYGLVGGASTDSLDPALDSSQVPYHFGRCWGDVLIETSPTDGTAVPWLAESFDSTADAQTWSIKLRKGVTFHNGKDMTSADVVATLLRHSDEKSKSGALGIMRDIAAIEADGQYAVTLKLKAPNADLPYLISDYHLIIQPEGGDPNAGIGTGAYMVDSVEHGVRYTGKKNPNYWNPDLGHVDSIEILVINDQTARMSALQSGQVHMVNRVDPKAAKLLAKAPGVEIVPTAGKGHYVFIMQCDKPPFDNLDLRLALKFAMNREEMLKQVLQGFGTVGNDFPINSAYALFPDDIPQRPYDPDKAAFHYKKSGHSGSVLLRTSDVAFPGAVDAATLFQQSAAKAGITVEVKREPGDGYWSNVWNVQPFCTSYWGGRPTQDTMYATAYLSTADWNETKWFRPDFDKLLMQARAELDDTKRKATYREMALMVHDEGGIIVPMFNDYIDGKSDKVQGYVQDKAGEFCNGYAALRCWLSA